MKRNLLSRREWWAALVITLMMAAARNAHACATCGLSAEDSKSHAYMSSVLFMMAVPYSIFLVGSVVAFFAYRAASRRRSGAEGIPPEDQPLANR
jgi:hypothetical protein